MAFAAVFPEFVARDSNGSGHQAQLQGVLPRPQPQDRGMEHAKRPALAVGSAWAKVAISASGSGGGQCHPPAAKAGGAAMPHEMTTVCD